MELHHHDIMELHHHDIMELHHHDIMGLHHHDIIGIHISPVYSDQPVFTGIRLLQMVQFNILVTNLNISRPIISTRTSERMLRRKECISIGDYIIMTSLLGPPKVLRRISTGYRSTGRSHPLYMWARRHEVQ